VGLNINSVTIWRENLTPDVL